MSGSSPVLREPSQRVSLRALPYWRLKAALLACPAWLAAVAAAVFAALTPAGWNVVLAVAAVLLALAPVPWLTFVPRIRYAVHRWEVTDVAIHVRHGWLGVVDEIVPLSRVQTVDATQGPLMRMFGLRAVTVRTASNVGAVSIRCLDAPLARSVVARLVAVTGASPGDAT